MFPNRKTQTLRGGGGWDEAAPNLRHRTTPPSLMLIVWGLTYELGTNYLNAEQKIDELGILLSANLERISRTWNFGRSERGTNFANAEFWSIWTRGDPRTRNFASFELGMDVANSEFWSQRTWNEFRELGTLVAANAERISRTWNEFRELGTLVAANAGRISRTWNNFMKNRRPWN